MPLYRTTSIKEVIARVIRNTGKKLPSIYYEDLLEWIPEGVEQLGTFQSLITTSTPSQGESGEVITYNHVANLPCGLVSLIAVEDKYGNRLPLGGDVTDITNQSSSIHTNTIYNQAANSTWNQNPNYEDEDGNRTTPIFGEDLSQVDSEGSIGRYYKIQLNTIQTSFESEFIKIHYRAMPIDEEGYPLIPDNSNYKSALYWYVMMMLIGAGYRHEVFNHQYCQQEFELYAGRALGQIRLPSGDEYEKLRNSWTRLVPPRYLHDDFFVGSQDDQPINK
jgi:hypothetical protein